ncbi:MAG: cytochrome c [Gammaproteobacteria bacterium]
MIKHGLNKQLATAVLGLSLGLANSAVAGDAAAGETKSQQCASCHGADGKAISDQFPNLAGQYEDYLRQSLKQYRSGERANAIMGAFATNLSDEDIADLAAYYAAQKGLGILPVK